MFSLFQLDQQRCNTMLPSILVWVRNQKFCAEENTFYSWSAVWARNVHVENCISDTTKWANVLHRSRAETFPRYLLFGVTALSRDKYSFSDGFTPPRVSTKKRKCIDNLLHLTSSADVSSQIDTDTARNFAWCQGHFSEYGSIKNHAVYCNAIGPCFVMRNILLVMSHHCHETDSICWSN